MKQALITFPQLCRLSTQLFIFSGKGFERAVAGAFGPAWQCQTQTQLKGTNKKR